MTASSTTKEFIINDKKVFSMLADELDKPSNNNDAVVKTSYLEDGKKLLAQYFYS